MTNLLTYFKGSFIFTFLGLIASGGIGYFYGQSYSALIQAVFVAVVLAVLEVSLSFDNAVVNAVVLKKMTPLWRHRFLTWGIAIAVFGMRLIFPLAIVSFMTWISPWEALVLAATSPKEYSDLMLNAHLEVAAFGGSFLLLVGLKYFFDEEKESHWIQWLEKPLTKIGRLSSIEIGVALAILLALMSLLVQSEQLRFIEAGLAGIIIYIAVDGIGAWLELSGKEQNDLNKASAGMFLYLEVLDASFSFDGVIGAFAITHNLFIIMIGLSIGAFFVRSLTILFVEKDTLTQFEYLEHGAFYAILSLAIMMLLDPFFHLPEWVTGLTGAFIIGLSLLSSLHHSRTRSQGKS